MQVKDLKEYIKDLPDDMEVVIEDNNRRGVPPIYPLGLGRRVWDDNYYTDDEKRIPERCMIISIDAELKVEKGTDNLFLDPDDYESVFRKNKRKSTEEQNV